MENKYKKKAIEVLVSHYGCKDEEDLNKCFLANTESYTMILEAMCQLAGEVEVQIEDRVKELEGLIDSALDRDFNDTIAFAEWISKYGYERDKEDKLWRYWDNGIGSYTTEELFNLFKKENDKKKD